MDPSLAVSELCLDAIQISPKWPFVLGKTGSEHFDHLIVCYKEIMSQHSELINSVLKLLLVLLLLTQLLFFKVAPQLLLKVSVNNNKLNFYPKNKWFGIFLYILFVEKIEFFKKVTTFPLQAGKLLTSNFLQAWYVNWL